jgi:hypothetical protein
MYRYGVGLALVALVAAGCTKEHAGALPSLSATPTPTATTATPTSTATTPAQQIAAAARRYVATLQSAGQTGDTTRLAALLATGCTCRDQVAYIKREAAAGHRITTRYVVESVVPHDASASTGSATLTFSAPASAVVDSSGHTVRTLAALRHAGLEMSFRRTGASWQIVRLDRLGG